MPCATMLTAAGTHACPVLPCSPRLARAHVRLPKTWRNRIIGHGGRNSLHDRAGNVRNLLRTRRGRIHLVVPDHIVANDGIPLVHASWCLPSAGNRGSRHHHTRAAYSRKLMPKDVEAHSCYFFKTKFSFGAPITVHGRTFAPSAWSTRVIVMPLRRNGAHELQHPFQSSPTTRCAIVIIRSRRTLLPQWQHCSAFTSRRKLDDIRRQPCRVGHATRP